jgi:hypothetical protein
MQTITTPMPSNTAGIERPRAILPLASLLLATAAAALATVAIVTDDVGSGKPATPAVATIASPNAGTGVAPGDPIVDERDGGACRLRAITATCP